MRRIIWTLIFGCFLGVFSESGFAATEDPAWATYISAQKRLQVAVHHLIGLHWPQFRETIEESRDLQLALADMKSARFYHLVQSSPERIIRDQGFKAFVDFDWQPIDEEQLLKENKKFRKLTKRTKKLQKSLAKNPHYQRIQDSMLILQKEREYLEIKARFRFTSEKVEEILRNSLH